MKAVMFIAVVLTLALITGCGPMQGTVALPNGYSFEMSGKRQPFLAEPSGQHLLPASQFMVSGNYVYGWIDKKDNLFFFLDTETGQLIQEITWSELDKITQERQAKKFSMQESITFWDVVTGAKKPNW